MISPWTAIIVHIVTTVKELLFIAGCISVLPTIIGLGVYLENTDIATEAATQRAETGKKLISCSCIIIALAVTAHVLIPPSPALTRVLVTQQLPEDADIEVVDELVYRVCLEATGR